MLFGVFILLSGLTALFGIIMLFIIFNWWFIRWEEKKLEETFGEDYLVYKKHVRRWV
jgi:protein-S-isoprenylcysteine O-methyltransferase Ste14